MMNFDTEFDNNWFSRWQKPKEFYRHAYEIERDIPAEDLFSHNKYKPLLECWIAGLFATALECKNPQLMVKHGRLREKSDFCLMKNSKVIPFELTEIDRPNRRRGLEYQEVTKGVRGQIEQLDSAEDAAVAIPQIATAILKKVKRAQNYSEKRSLLIFVNLWDRTKHVSDRALIELAHPAREAFDSVWIIWGDKAYQTWPAWRWVELSKVAAL